MAICMPKENYIFFSKGKGQWSKPKRMNSQSGKTKDAKTKERSKSCALHRSFAVAMNARGF